MLVKTLLSLIFCVVFMSLHAQISSSNISVNKEHIPANTPKEKSWWNLLHYTISVIPDYNKKFISGANEVTFAALRGGKVLQIDLQQPMSITKVTWKNVSLPCTREKDTYRIFLPRIIKKGEVVTIIIQFEGEPQPSINPPFDNGWIWAKDEKGRPWMSIACEGSGASIWLPCKDVLYDEPDRGVSFRITVPDTMTAVANGRLEKKIVNNNGTTTYSWKVVNPINNYNIVPYIGNYVNWHLAYKGSKGKLDCDFWVLDYNLEKGKRHLKQTDTMLRAFEYWLGPYPFYEDGYKLVEAPMPGMEHQSAVAYGNGFQNGYRGKDIISGTGWGLKWDFILVHESGHEWFGNSITSSNYEDTWIHEGFTKYLETLYTDFVFGRAAGNEYALGTWKRIKNDQPILGTGTSDKYYKSGAMLHTIRQIIGDSVFRGCLKGLNQIFYHRTVTTDQILSFINQYTKRDFSKVFAQYLQTTQVPVFEYNFQRSELHFRWTNCVEGFAMPLNISINDKTFRLIYPTTKWQSLPVSNDSENTLVIDKNVYVQTKQQDEREKKK
ncbi:MAG TPA: M1 family metallopeptidase [Chitinophagaceae bacterium]|nr:M1 family metallopeptidase [Chitinophagaceae bacterium]